MYKAFSALFLIVLFSCASVPNNDSNYHSFDEALEIGIQRIGNDLPEGSDIAVLDFKSDNPNLSSYIIEEIYDKLIIYRKINGGKLSIMERSRIDTIKMEVDYQLTGEVDDNEIINIGHQLGANYVVTGQIIFSGEAYRLRVFAIDVEKGRRIASSSLNIRSNDRQINYLLSSKTSDKKDEQNQQSSDHKIKVLNDYGDPFTSLLKVGGTAGFSLGIYTAGDLYNTATLEGKWTFEGNVFINFNAGYFFHLPVLRNFVLQTEVWFAADSYDVFSGSDFLQSASYSSLMIPIIAKLQFHPGIFMLQAYIGGNISVPLAKYKTEGHDEFETDYKTLGGIVFGGSAGIVTGYIIPFIDLRFLNDSNVLTIAHDGDKEVSKRSKFNIMIGVEIPIRF